MTQTPLLNQSSTAQRLVYGGITGLFSLYHLRGGFYGKISRSEVPELATLNIDLLTRCVLIAQTSRLEAANTFRNALKPN